MAILLVRHGETTDNVQRTLQVPQSPLSENGIAQAKLLANRLANKNIQRIVCSDHQRTQQTAHCIQKRIDSNITLHKELRERNFGDWRGLAYDALESNPLDHSSLPPNGESIDEFHHRIKQTWLIITDLAEQTNGDLLVVTHGLVCKALLDNHIQLGQNMSIPAHWGNTALSVIEQTKPWTATLLNCTSHLTEQLNKAAHGGALV